MKLRILLVLLSISSLSSAIEIHGHRGSRGTHPENSIPAFNEALMAKADVLELDLQFLDSETIVVFHDPDVPADRCQSSSGEVTLPTPIHKLTEKQLSSITCGKLPHPKFAHQKKIATEIPTLEALLKWLTKEAPTARLNIEMKMTPAKDGYVPNPAAFAKRLVGLLETYSWTEKTVVQSFDGRALTAMREIAPNIGRVSLTYEQPLFCDIALKFGAAIASPDFKDLSEKEIAKCQTQKIRVIPWTANTPQDWDKLVTLKVDGIITDYPRELRQHLHGQAQ